MQEGTKLKLEKLRSLLKKEPQPISMERAEELFRQAFPNVKDTYKGISKYRKAYPKYFRGINIAAITDEGDKIRDYLKRITKGKTEPFVTSTPKILKAAKADAGPATVKAIVNKFNEGGEKVLLRGGKQFAGSQYDDLYKNSKKLKILGSGEIKDKVNIEANLASKSAIEKLEKIGGSIQLKK